MKNDMSAKSPDEARLESIMKEWRKTLPPKEFTLGTVGNGMTKGTLHHYPDLYFREDDSVPGLYFAKLDPSSLAKRNGNGNGNGHHATIEGLDDK